jgi:purine-binding chemotaxis protein CheW
MERAMHTTHPASEDGQQGRAAHAGKYLTFFTGGEEYGLPVLKVREIIKMMTVTSVPQAPACVRGIINLRGKVIPVTDLRLKFGLQAQEATDQTCIIVVEVERVSGKAMMGLLVDGVSEVLNVQSQDIEPPPSLGDGIQTDYMRGVAKVKGTVKLLLDIDRVMVGSEFEAIAA